MERSEAIEIVREYYPSSGKDLNEAIEALIPELKENEDERIRKELIEHVKDQQSSFICAPDCRDRYEEEENDKYNSWIAWLEKQGSQNLANSGKTCKVEPKFKVGDWVVNTITKEVEQVIELTGCEYICSGHLAISFNNQHLLKRWTIEDAKDGDVIVNGSNVFIFSHRSSTRAMGYCHINLDDRRFYDDKGKNECFGLIDTVFTPATKEQRDLLFQKMKEAGYEWDAEKKELRKVEQKPAWSEDDEERLNSIIESYKYLLRDYKACHDVDYIPYNSDTVIRNVVDDVNFLESLKDRVKPQPKQEWSEEDEKMIEFWNLYYEHKVGDWPNKDVVENLEKFRDWLKSLKERYAWKPSDEQMQALEFVIHIMPLQIKEGGKK